MHKKEELTATQDRLSPEESSILTALLHLNVSGRMLRLTAMQVRMQLEQDGFRIVRKDWK
jgi:hypothetical protein